MLNDNNNSLHDDTHINTPAEKQESNRPTTRRDIEDYLEQKALKERLKDVFEEECLLED